MKLALCHNTYFYLYAHYREVIRALQQQYGEVVCIAPSDGAEQRLRALGVSCRHLAMSRRNVKPWTEAPVLWRFVRAFRAEQPDLIFNFSIKPVIYGGIAARWAVPQTPVFSMITGLGYVFIGRKLRQRVLRRLVRWMYKWALSGSRIVYFQNKNDSELFLNYGMVRAEQVRVLPGTGINLQEYAPAARKPFSGRFLFIGRLLKDKGVYELVEAGAELKKSHKDARVALLGPVDDNPAAISPAQLRAWQEAGIVEYLGTQSDVRPYIQESDVFVLPSYREGLPRATLEAMALAKPVVTTDVPGCRETVEHGKNGYLVPAADAAALAESMKKFFRHPERVSSFGEHSRRMAEERFDVRHVVDRIVSDIGDSLPGAGATGASAAAL